MMKKSERFFFDRLPQDFCERIEQGKFNRTLYPVSTDREAWKTAAATPVAAKIIASADKVLEGDLPQLLFSNYCQYPLNGNRSEYETPYFQRRREMAFLALALCLTGDREKYLSRLLDYVIAILEEGAWCLPAHARWEKNNIDRWRFCDLFAAETGAVMSLLYQILGDELESVVPGIKAAIRKKTLDQTVNTICDKNIEHWWETSNNPQNWTVWCSSNAILTSLVLVDDCSKLALLLRRFLAHTSRFINHFADDGYCPEGPSYYMKANLMVFQTLLLLEKALPGCAEKLFCEPKLKVMMEFIVNARITDTYAVSFGDSQPRFNPCPALIIPAGKEFKSQRLMAFKSAKEYPLGACGDHLASMLALLFDMPAENAENAPEDNSLTVFQDRLAILRSQEFSLSLKAGNNDEPHNHNDLGNFELFYGTDPVIVDAGTGTYSKEHFSDQRYNIWHIRGTGHNAPVFGDFEQITGKEYTSTFTLTDGKLLTCDLTNAYPEEAQVKSARRIINYQPEKVVVEDFFELAEPCRTSVTLLTVKKPEIISESLIQLGEVTLQLEDIVFEESKEMPVLGHNDINIWNAKLTALKLTTTQSHIKMTFTTR